MNNMITMTRIELLKAVRSKVPLLTAAVFLLINLAMALMMFVLKDPELARRLGIISMKAQLTGGSADWPTYLGMISMVVALAGLIFFSMICSWVFGREFADGTLKDWLAVPVSRSTVLLAKFITVSIWAVALVIQLIVISLPLGEWIGLQQNTSAVILAGLGRMLISAGLTILLIFPFAFFAGLGRGYLLPVGVAILTLIASQVLATMGWGEVFPWAIPGMYADFSGTGFVLTPSMVWIVILTGLAGIGITLLWYQKADQSR
ncbi:MAG: ABC transporter permease subunit [Chloroflexi bacterium]|jgi:ABC-2 type transport system permease protein|nr:ABC transporter permease [Anaerolineaceae bacterium]NMB87018.1 ABC transporter permease subunit [Chloroflexota bacterium]